jgi:thiol-disulfide isomerase/thioredoxin
MSGLLFLTHDDFGIRKTEKGPVMGTNIPGFSLILFYSTHCEHCKELIPIFKRLPGTMGGCQFGMINVSTNRPCVEMSQSTIAPIKYVPYIVLYFNGEPFMMYKGIYRDDEIRKFVIEVANNIQKKQQFSKEKVKENTEEGIPKYCTGHPICGGKDQLVCYINFEGYEKLQKSGSQKPY